MATPLLFDAASHTYTTEGGLVLPSVSQILSEVGIIEKMLFSESAGRRGTLVHECLLLIDLRAANAEQVLNFLPEGDRELVRPYLDSHAEFRQFFPDPFVGHEERLGGELAGFAGTVDRLTDTAILDYKTGRKQKWHALQLGGYYLLEPRPRLVDVYLSDKGRFKPSRDFVEHDPGKASSVFQAALRLYQWRVST